LGGLVEVVPTLSRQFWTVMYGISSHSPETMVALAGAIPLSPCLSLADSSRFRFWFLAYLGDFLAIVGHEAIDHQPLANQTGD